MNKLSRLFPDSFTLAILVVVVLSLVLPCGGESARWVAIGSEIAIALLFFLQGARLSRPAVLAGILHWRLHLIIFAATFVAFPLLGLALSPLSGTVLTPPLYVGLVFLCTLPSSVQASVVFTSIAGGNVPAALCSASISEQRVDEGGHRRALRQHDEGAKQHEDDHDRQEPELLPLLHEGPELEDELSHGSLSSDPIESELPVHVGAGARRLRDAIALSCRIMSPAHRILGAETPDEPHRRDESVEDDAEEDSRIDPSQRLARRHPDPVDGCQGPRREESRKEQEDADDQGPRARAGAADDGGPEPDRAEDAADEQSELPELCGVGGARHPPDPPNPHGSVKLVLGAPVLVADQRLLV